MFESLDENSSLRIPPPDRQQRSDAMGGFGRLGLIPIFGLLLGFHQSMSRFDRALSVISAVAVFLVFLVFEYRAYQDAKQGPTDLGL